MLKKKNKYIFLAIYEFRVYLKDGYISTRKRSPHLTVCVLDIVYLRFIRKKRLLNIRIKCDQRKYNILFRHLLTYAYVYTQFNYVRVT